eukprot:TRINITY_DN13352_c0_g1_i1.p1 TRINITY_DN13352_c0_g1~~TRINITY_DN13352_c0_g1_i1.p1  ORF type:complete len:190 (+),score=-17.48 TRINITY_DN13352_c0_g1_i1:865-1434(+)
MNDRVFSYCFLNPFFLKQCVCFIIFIIIWPTQINSINLRSLNQCILICGEQCSSVKLTLFNYQHYFNTRSQSFLCLYCNGNTLRILMVAFPAHFIIHTHPYTFRNLSQKCPINSRKKQTHFPLFLQILFNIYTLQVFTFVKLPAILAEATGKRNSGETNIFKPVNFMLIEKLQSKWKKNKISLLKNFSI